MVTLSIVTVISVMPPLGVEIGVEIDVGVGGVGVGTEVMVPGEGGAVASTLDVTTGLNVLGGTALAVVAGVDSIVGVRTEAGVEGGV